MGLAPTSSPEIALIQSRYRYRTLRFSTLAIRVLFWAGVVMVGAVMVLALVQAFWPPWLLPGTPTPPPYWPPSYHPGLPGIAASP